jgi:hypothetical protein
MVQRKTREHKKIFFDGSSDEIAEKLSEFLLDILADKSNN